MVTLGLIFGLIFGLMFVWGLVSAAQDASAMPEGMTPRFETIGMAHAWAHKVGIRTRPVKQALVKAYMRRANASGLSHASKLYLAACWSPVVVKSVYRRRSMVASSLTPLDLAFS